MILEIKMIGLRKKTQRNNRGEKVVMESDSINPYSRLNAYFGSVWDKSKKQY